MTERNWLQYAFAIERRPFEPAQRKKLVQWTQWNDENPEDEFIDDVSPEHDAFIPLHPPTTPVVGIVPHLQCAECGYNLRGHTLGQRCPECEFEIAKSIVAHREREKAGRSTARAVFMTTSLAAGLIATLLPGSFAQVQLQGPSVIVLLALTILPGFAFGWIGARTLDRQTSLLAFTAFSWPMFAGAVCCFGTISGSNLQMLPIASCNAFMACVLGAGVYRWLAPDGDHSNNPYARDVQHDDARRP